MGNILQRKPQTQSISVQDDREAMDLILELSEQKMNEGDYLKISECLKVIHESKAHNVVPTYRILSRFMIEPNSLYRLTHDETIQLMRSRYKDYCEFCIIKLEESIAEDQILLRQTIGDKKVAWTRLKHDNTDKSRQEHKELVRNEKRLKTRINERIMGIQKNELLLDEFKRGNYSTIHL
jgi:hypothetical protein